jgi:hypothetical protein
MVRPAKQALDSKPQPASAEASFTPAVTKPKVAKPKVAKPKVAKPKVSNPGTAKGSYPKAIPLKPRKKKPRGPVGCRQAAKRAENAELTLHASRMKASGMTTQRIASELGVSYGKAYKLVDQGNKAFLADAEAEIIQWKTAAIADLVKAAQELWVQWERSKQDRRQTRTKVLPDGTREVTEIVEGKCGDPRYLGEFRATMDEIGKLRGVFTRKMEIKSTVNDTSESDLLRDQFAGMVGSTRPAPPEA